MQRAARSAIQNADLAGSFATREGVERIQELARQKLLSPVCAVSR